MDFFTYLTKPDGLSVAKCFYCNELSVAKTSNKLSVAKAGAMDSPSLKMKFVAVYIQRAMDSPSLKMKFVAVYIQRRLQ
jgi:hypothetical protein